MSLNFYNLVCAKNNFSGASDGDSALPGHHSTEEPAGASLGAGQRLLLPDQQHGRFERAGGAARHPLPGHHPRPRRQVAGDVPRVAVRQRHRRPTHGAAVALPTAQLDERPPHPHLGVFPQPLRLALHRGPDQRREVRRHHISQRYKAQKKI